MLVSSVIYLVPTLLKTEKGMYKCTRIQQMSFSLFPLTNSSSPIKLQIVSSAFTQHGSPYHQKGHQVRPSVGQGGDKVAKPIISVRKSWQNESFAAFISQNHRGIQTRRRTTNNDNHSFLSISLKPSPRTIRHQKLPMCEYIVMRGRPSKYMIKNAINFPKTEPTHHNTGNEETWIGRIGWHAEVPNKTAEPQSQTVCSNWALDALKKQQLKEKR